MYDTGSGWGSNAVRGALLVMAAAVGLAGCDIGGGSSSHGFRAPASSGGRASLQMSTNAADTSVTDSAAALGLGIGGALLNTTGFFFGTASDMLFTPPGTYNCSGGGTVTFASTQAQAGVVSAGDKFSLQTKACVNSAGTMLKDGGISMTVAQVGSLNDAGLTAEQRFVGSNLQLTFNNFDGGANVVFTGDMTLGADTSQGFELFSMTGTSLALGFQTNTGTTDTERVVEPATGQPYAIRGGADANGITHATIDYMLDSAALNGTVNIATLTPFQILGNNVNPSSGVATVTGAAGNGVKVTALSPTQAQLDYEFTGDNQFNDLMRVVNWDAIMAKSPTKAGITGMTQPGPQTGLRGKM